MRRYGHKALSLSRSQHSEQSERTGVPSGSLDHWRQGVLLQLEPAPVLEIVITVPARPLQHYQPHHGALQPPPLTINNHHPASQPLLHHSHSHKQKMYWKPWPSFFILPRNGMKFSTLLHAIQKKSEKDTTRPVKNYMDCIAVFRTSSRYWEIGRDRARKKYFLDLFVQEQWGSLIINIGVI